MSNEKRTAFYIGVTNDIEFRVLQHKTDTGSKLVSKYRLYALVYYENLEAIGYAMENQSGPRTKSWDEGYSQRLVY